MAAKKIDMSSGVYLENRLSEYYLNMVNNFSMRSNFAGEFIYQLFRHRGYDDIDSDVNADPDSADSTIKTDSFFDKARFQHYSKKALPRVKPSDWRDLRAYFEEKVAQADTKAIPPVGLDNLIKISEMMNMDDLEREVLKFIYVITEHPDTYDFFLELVEDKQRLNANVIAAALNRPKQIEEISRLIAPDAKLYKHSVIYYASEREQFPHIDGSLSVKIHKGVMDKGDVIRALVGKKAETDLTIDDYPHLQPRLNQLITKIKNAIAAGEKGVNVAINGPAGGGKTELVKAIAKHLGLDIILVGEDDSSTELPQYSRNNKNSKQNRMAKLQQARALLENSTDTMLALDEVEDLFEETPKDAPATVESKVDLNRDLEGNTNVTFFIGNDMDKFHKSVSQRFFDSFYVDVPPAKVRQNMWRKQLELQGQTLGETDIIGLSRQYAIHPRIIKEAVRAYRLSGQDMAAVHDKIRASAEGTENNGQAYNAEIVVPACFNPESVNISNDNRKDMARAIDNLKCKRDFTMAVRGDEGSGRKALIGYMAEEGLSNPYVIDCTQFRGVDNFSDALKAVAGIFQECAVTGQLIVLDNAEYLGDVDGGKDFDPDEFSAQNLTSMIKSSPAKVAFIFKKETRLPSDLERLLAFDIEVEDVQDKQFKEMLEGYFDLRGHSLDGIDVSTFVPEDFALARRRLEAQGKMDGIGFDEVVEELDVQRQYRGRHRGKSKIGFPTQR